MLQFRNNCDGKVKYLNAVVSTVCPHNCIYCVSEKNKQNVEADIEKMADTILYFNWPEVVIEGQGEPMVFPERVSTLIDFIRPYISRISMFTSLPENLNTEKGYQQLKNIISKLDGTNISIRHYNPLIAAEIMRNNDQSGFRNRIIRRLIKDGLANKFRISIEVTNTHFKTAKDIKDNLKYFYNIGVKNIKVSEIMKHSEYFILIESLIPVKLGDAVFDGCSTYIKKIPEWNLYLKKDQTLMIKRACFMVEPKIKPTKKAKIKLFLRKIKSKFVPFENYKIIWPDGTYSNSW